MSRILEEGTMPAAAARYSLTIVGAKESKMEDSCILAAGETLPSA